MSYYDKIQNLNKKPDVPVRHTKRLVTLDESVDEQLQKPNIFNEGRILPPINLTDAKKGSTSKKQGSQKYSVVELNTQPKNKKQNSLKQQPSAKNTNLKQIRQKKKKQSKQLSKQDKGNKQQRQQKLPKLQKLDKSQRTKFGSEEKKISTLQIPEFDQYSNDQPQVHGISKKSWLSLTESLSLSLGHFSYSYNFPIRREIPIIANNLDLQRQKYENGTYISQSFDNNLQVSFFIFFLKAVIMENFLRLSVFLWIAAIVISFIISGEQYKPGKQILLGIFVFYCVASIILQLLSIRNRRDWQQSSRQIKYKVYHYDNQNRMAEWILTDVSDLRPGNIYKIPAATINKPSVIPADSVLLHGPRRILQVDDSSIIQYLSPLEKQQRICLKQTLIKQQLIMLPLTGVIHYELAAPEIAQQNIYGKFIIQQPRQQTLNITYNNVMLRGTSILSPQIILTDDNTKKAEQKQSQMLAVVLQTGIDSLVLKTSQYPFQYRKQYLYVKFIDILLIVCSILYLLVVGSGILIGYIYVANTSINRGYYIDTYLNLGETPVTLTEIVLQQFGNLIMIVPIMLRISYLFYVNIAGRIISKKLNIQIKDFNMMTQAKETQVLVTTIGGDLIRMGDNKYSNKLEDQNDAESPNIFDVPDDDNTRPKIRNRSLQSIRVGGIHHNFLTSRVDDELYSVKDIDLLCYFMSIALLTCNRRSPTPLERGIIERANKQFNVKIQKSHNILKIGKLRVTKIFTISATQKYPYKLLFYKHAGSLVEQVQSQSIMKMQNKQKVLCLVRGETTKLTQKISQMDGSLLSQFSNRLHQEKGYHIELLGKFVMSLDEFIQIKNFYLNTDNKKRDVSGLQDEKPVYGIDKFYEQLGKHMQRTDPMGLLIWQNPYSILSNNLLPISSLPQLQYKIIIAPASKSQTNPQFQSIHSITNYLLKASKLPLKQISNKIIHNYTNKQTFWALLKNQKILVLNGWNYRMIKNMLNDLKEVKRNNKKQLKLLGYIQQDQYAWVLKQTDVSISSKGDGYDLEKYSDVLINQDTSSTTTDIIRKMFIYAQAHRYCIQSIILCHLMKSVILATIQFINHFYTWGTGLAIIASPLYLILEVGILLDFLYYLFPLLNEEATVNQPKKQLNKNEIKNQQQQQKTKKPSKNNTISAQSVLIQIFVGIAIGSFLTFIPIYSMTQPPTKYGTIEPKQFTNILIHFILYHAVILRKIFMKPYTLSLYKIFIIAVQIAVYYLGLLVVSAVDYYQYVGIIWYVFQAKLIIVCVFCVWMVIGVYWLVFMLQNIIYPKPKIIKHRYEKLAKKAEDVSAEQQTVKVGEVVDLD